ncbi:MAG: alpha/beta hydrolase [Novosphingobium sp.]
MPGAFSLPVEGATISGETRGEDPALVLLHGLGGSRATWDRVVNALPADLPLLRYDLRGFGASIMDEDVEFHHADDLLAVLDSRGIEKATLVGLSLGGAVAINFAIDHPERVERLILVSPAMMAWEWSEEWRERWRIMTRAAREGNIAEARRLWWAHPLFATTRASDAAAELHDSIEAFSGRVWVKDPQRKLTPDVERIHLIKAPTLLLTGELDVPDFRLIADLLGASVPDIRRIDYAGAGHMLPLERPADVVATIA